MGSVLRKWVQLTSAVSGKNTLWHTEADTGSKTRVAMVKLLLRCRQRLNRISLAYLYVAHCRPHGGGYASRSSHFAQVRSEAMGVECEETESPQTDIRICKTTGVGLARTQSPTHRLWSNRPLTGCSQAQTASGATQCNPQKTRFDRPRTSRKAPCRPVPKAG